MRLSLRTQRLKVAWVLAIPFFLLSSPSVCTLLVGVAISALGLTLRAWAAGSILKDEELAMGGPYSRIRHPLYVGSMFMGLGLVVAAGRWWLLLLFLLLFLWAYGRTIRAEEVELRRRFGEAYLQYRVQVPAFFPRLMRREASDPAKGFRIHLYRRNKEWQAALGTLLGFGLLWARMSLLA